MALLLMYNLSPARQGAVRMLCARLKIRVRAVEASEYAEKLGALAGMEEKRNEPFSGEPFSDEMLLMAGFAPPVALKAVLTPTNAEWDSVQLHQELLREHEAAARGGKAHGA